MPNTELQFSSSHLSIHLFLYSVSLEAFSSERLCWTVELWALKLKVAECGLTQTTPAALKVHKQINKQKCGKCYTVTSVWVKISLFRIQEDLAAPPHRLHMLILRFRETAGAAERERWRERGRGAERERVRGGARGQYLHEFHFNNESLTLSSKFCHEDLQP